MKMLAIAAILCLPLVSCVGTQMKQKHDQLIAQGYSVAYADGFSDGWGSGQQAGGNPYAPFTKDVPRYLHDTEYKTGWDDGFQNGKGRYESVR
jgi:hypothetical protein